MHVLTVYFLVMTKKRRHSAGHSNTEMFIVFKVNITNYREVCCTRVKKRSTSSLCLHLPAWSYVVWGSYKAQNGTSLSWQRSAQTPEHQEVCMMWWTLGDLLFGYSHLKPLLEIFQFSSLSHQVEVQLDLNVSFCLRFEALTEICTV